jgi:hypothetical protein
MKCSQSKNKSKKSSPITTPAGAAGAWAADFCVTVASLLTRAKARASLALAGSVEVSGFV